MKLKNIIKAVLFSGAVIVMFFYTYRVLSWKDTAGGYISSMESLYELEEDRVDVLFLGSSHCYCSVNNAVLWEKYGIASFSLAISGQDLASSYHCMKEALKTQTPDVVCVEMFYSNLHGYLDQGNMYRNLLGYRLSENFADAVNAIAPEEEKKDILLKWPIIHTRYAELSRQDFRKSHVSETYIGYQGGFTAQYIGEIPIYQEGEVVAIEEEEEMWLEKIIELAERSGTKVCFFLAPYSADVWAQMHYGYVEQFAHERDVPFLNMIALQQELGLDIGNDFIDWGHTNSYGAGKVSDYLGRFLKENYALEDRRGEKGYELWDENLKVWKHEEKNNQLRQIADPGSYLDAIKGLEDYTVIVATGGEYLAEAENLADRLWEAGIGDRFFQSRGAWIIENSEPAREVTGDDYFDYMSIGKSDLCVRGGADQVQIIVDRQEYGKTEQGINIVVYDNLLEQVVDAVGFQASGEYTCIR